jgi:hypothetical protein
MQLKTLTSDNIRKITDRVVSTQELAFGKGYRDVDIYLKTLQFTRDQVIEYARTGALSKITLGNTGFPHAGTIRMIDILTADGWVHILGGVVQ